MKLKLTIIATILLLSISSNGQNAVSQFNSLLEVSERIRTSNSDSAVSLAIKALCIAESNNNIQQKIEAEFALGSAYYSRNYYDLSLQHLEKSLELARANDKKNWVAMNLGRIGNVYQLKSRFDLALNAYSQAAVINQQNNDKQQLARVLVNMGSVYGLTGNYNKAIELMLEALETFETICDHEGIAWSSLSISRVFNRIGIIDKSLNYAELALNQYTSINNENGITLSLTELSNIYYRAKLYPKALTIAKQVLEVNSRSENIHGKAANYLLIGIIYYKMDSLSLSLKNLEMAKSLKFTLNDSIDIAKLNLYLGNVLAAQNNYSQSLKHLETAQLIAKKQGLIVELSEIYQSLSAIYSKKHDHKLALKYYMQFSNVKDSINSNDISRLEMQYAFEKRERELELINMQREIVQEANLKRQRTYSIFISVALLISISFALVIYHFLREKQKNNKTLTERNTEIEKQKKEIEEQRDYANQQRDQIATQKQQITDSITYASRIQRAILPRSESIEQQLHNYFIFYQPKNIVSGDFYWVTPLADGRLAVVVADCTGHGVPGAFMSMLGITLLKDLSTSSNETAGDILFRLRRTIISVLHQSGNEGDSQDGMDMAMMLIDKDKKEFQFAGAYLPLIVTRHVDHPNIECANSIETLNKFKLFEIKGDKMPIGFHVIGEKQFSTKCINYLPSDTFYLFSDGYTDQFGGEKRSKYMLINFKAFLLSIQHLPLAQQREQLVTNFENYKGNGRQMDDVLVFGFRLS